MTNLQGRLYDANLYEKMWVFRENFAERVLWSSGTLDVTIILNKDLLIVSFQKFLGTGQKIGLKIKIFLSIKVE